MGYYNIYEKRLNRYGFDYQSRIQGERERDFDLYLLKSVYRVDFRYNGDLYAGSLERNRDDESETTAFLLTRTKDVIPGGTILFIPGFKKEGLIPWLVWYQLEREAKGYNKYLMLKLNYELTWRDQDGKEQSQWVHFVGPGTKEIRDSIKSHTNMYLESENLYMFITSFNPSLQRDTYFEVNKGGDDGVTLHYWITEFDMLSTEGVGYYSFDQRHKIDMTPKPEPQPSDDPNDFYWLTGGESNG